MRIKTKGLFWTATSSALVILNSLVGIVAIEELRVTDRLTAEDYHVTQRLGRLHSQLFDYYSHALSYRIGQESDSESFADIRQRIRAELSQETSNPRNPALAPSFASARAKILDLLDHDPMPFSSQDPTTFLDMEFFSRFQSSLDALSEVAETSVDVIAEDRARNEALSRRYFMLLISLSALTILVLLGRNLFLRRAVLRPMQTLIDVLNRIKAGDLTARWPNHRQDEIGDMGHTINDTVQELELRRKERIQFIGSIAHDLKNPLAALSLNCDLALRHSDTLRPEAAMDALKRVKLQLDRLTRITDDLLITSKQLHPVWSLKPQALDIISLVEETLELFRGSYPDWNFAFAIESPPPAIQADGARLVQVLTNLLSNATKYSRPGSEIQVAVGALEEGAYFEVRDRGVGIPEDKKKDLFAPYHRLEAGKRMSSGTGLGLVNVKEIVSRHGGRVVILDRAGGGSTFRVELPPGIGKNLEDQAAG